MVKEENKLGYGLKGKLISAVAMLLVAVIMVVSSTYAWFTLSTAPEVTGITTAVGANGALEMLLATKDENGKWVYNNGTVNGDANTYWGNLVNLTGNDYGQEKITLYPSILNLSDEGGTSEKIHLTAPLATPTYGSDGRVEGVSGNTSYGIYNTADQVFYPAGANDYGFRGVGVASGMTPRQLAFREARAQVVTLMAKARNTASDSLTNNGSTLGNLAIKKAMLTSPTFTNTELKAIENMINQLKISLGHIEDAYMQAFYALAASSVVGDDDAYANAKALIDSCTTPSQVLTALSGAGITVPTEISEGVAAYEDALEAVNDADTAFNIDTNVEKTDYVWTDFSTALYHLVDMDNMVICGIPANKINEGNNKDAIISAAMGTGVTVTIATGGGVYADIADQTGDYKVDIKLDLAPVGYDYQMGAKMDTATDVVPVYLQRVFNYLSGTSMEPQKGDAKMPLTEFYGYVIDLAFRTNAAQSNLLLQQKGIDRIYGDNNNDSTMGAGSTMTFASADINFNNAQVKALMSNIRIVFFDTTGRDILAYAKLDMTEDNLVIDADGITAYMYLYEKVDNVFRMEDGTLVYSEKVTEGEDTTTKYYSDKELTTEVTVDENAKLTKVTELPIEDSVITSLTQNTETHVSALVYLDGETIENSHVAASVAQSMTGKMNLQFASDATLVPMEYGNLHQTGTVTEEVNVTAKADEAVVYTPRSISDATWSIDELPTDWDFDTTTGKLTIPVNATADEVVIKATVNEKVVREITVKVAAPSGS